MSKKISSSLSKHKWIVVVLVILLVGGIYSAVQDTTDGNANKYDYQTPCLQGDFVAARAIQDQLYQEYSKALGRWRSGEWKDREARQAQEQYRSAVAYIFGQEASMIYLGEDAKKNEKLIGMLVAIPIEGAPLQEGKHGNGMFYKNDAGIGVPMAIDHMVYQSWVRFYNDRCEQLLNLALANDDMELARKVAKLYKTEVDTHFEQDTVRGDGYSLATVLYNDSRRSMAIERCE